MPRYIDTEDFKHLINASSLYGTEEWVKVMNLLADTPTADVQEVVRCKDCIFSKRDMDVHPDPKILNKDRWCELYGGKSPGWFCADGERRTDEKPT